MDFSNRWEKIEEIGKGGQGIVNRVIDKDKIETDIKNGKEIRNSIKYLASVHKEIDSYKLFKKAIIDIIRMQNPAYCGALKEYYKPEYASKEESEKAKERIKKEIEAMSKVSHPNLLKILNHDSDGEWFVSQYYPKGSLAKNLHKFKGNLKKALKAFRPLVEGVKVLHEKGIVHRDIKPQNVFLDENDNLILGDFGIVFFEDAEHKRISAKLEKVGSRDYMPSWLPRKKILEDIKPSFDIFTLGKLLYSMVSGELYLNLWYWDHPEYDLESKFPYDNSMKYAKEIFKKCIVQYEKDCYSNTSALLSKINKVLFFVKNRVDPIAPEKDRICKVCGIDSYKLRFSKDIHEEIAIKEFGLTKGERTHILKIFACNNCGHTQIFAQTPEGFYPDAWAN